MDNYTMKIGDLEITYSKNEIINALEKKAINYIYHLAENDDVIFGFSTYNSLNEYHFIDKRVYYVDFRNKNIVQFYIDLLKFNSKLVLFNLINLLMHSLQFSKDDSFNESKDYIKNEINEFLKKTKNKSIEAFIKAQMKDYSEYQKDNLLKLIQDAIKVEKEKNIALHLEFIYVDLLEEFYQKGMEYLKLLPSKYDFDELDNSNFKTKERRLKIKNEISKTEAGIKEIKEALAEDKSKDYTLDRIKEFETDFSSLKKHVMEQDTFQKQLVDDISKMKGVFGKPEWELIAERAGIIERIKSIESQISNTNTRLNDLKDNTNDSLNRIHSAYRIVLIVIGIIFTALTGTFIGVLIYFIDIVNSLGS